MVRDIVLLGESVLRRKSKPVRAVDAAVRRLIDDLLATVAEAHGLGLAAPQVGVARRVIVAHDGEIDPLVLVNPRILKRSGRDTGTEGCLSMPGLYGLVPRSKTLVVEALDRAGRTVTIEAEGLLARCIQHEIDHLNGVLFIDHAESLWWLEEVDGDAEGEPEGEEPGVRRVPTTTDDVVEYFDELRRSGVTTA